MRDTILVNTHGCFACPVRCKRNVKVDEPYTVNPIYGGPEYETLAAFGSNCGVGDLKAIAKCHELCNSYALDSIAAGTAVSFAMECFEKGILTSKDVDGLDLKFGNASAMISLVEMIAKREGIGDLLAEGVLLATKKIGKESEKLAMHVKGQSIPMHEPRFKQGLGLGYAVSSTGAEHILNLHDTGYSRPGPLFDALQSLGIPKPLPPQYLGPEKVRMYKHQITWRSFINCLVMCSHIYTTRHPDHIFEVVQGVTGLRSTVYEFMKVGQRCLTMARAFNAREGFRRKDDWLPDRFFVPFEEGPLKGVAIDKTSLSDAIETFYGMMGFNKDGIPTKATLDELGIDWISSQLSD